LAQAAEENRRLAAERGHAERMEMLGRLAGGVAHDFNNLLTVILAATSVLRESDPSPPTLEVLNDLEQATESASLVTRQLLTFSRSGAGKVETTDIGEALGRAAKLLERLLGERHPLRFVSTNEPSFVRIDPGQLEQCVMNLVINARDALPNGGEIELSHHVEESGPAGDWAVITVADRGTGMSEEVRAHIFDAFYTTKPRGQGTGLGLSNLHAVVEGAGGTVRLESETGRGTRFELRLPRSVEQRDRSALPTTLAPRGVGHVVLVEDVERLRSLVSDDLRRHGYEVSSFGSAEQALAGLDPAQKPDVLVSDVILPGLDGVQLAERLEARFGPLRAVFTTGYSGDASLNLDHRADHRLLLKPYRTRALLQALHELMGDKGMHS
jgi:CheY-like chemotaxis protein